MRMLRQSFENIFERLRRLSMNEYVILLIVASSLINVFFITALLVLFPVYMLATGQVKKTIPENKTDYILFLFAVIALISTFYYNNGSPESNYIMPAVGMRWLAVGIFILIIDIYFFVNIMTKRAFHLSLVTISILSVFINLVGYIQMQLGLFADPGRPDRVASFFCNENYFATALEFIVIIVLYLFFHETKNWKKIGYLLILGVNISGLWLCKSRTAYIAVAVTLFVFLFIYKRKISYFIMLFLIIFCLILIKNPTILPRFDQFMDYLDLRVGIWSSALHKFLEKPWFGFGYYGYRIACSDLPGELKALHTHNLFLEILLNFGIIGGSPLVFFFVKKILATLRTVFREKQSLTIALVFSTIIALFLHGLADTTIFWPQTGIYVVLILAAPKIYQNENVN